MAGPSLFGHGIQLFSNFPAEGNHFERTKYRQIEFDGQESGQADSGYGQLVLKTPGTFHYHFRLHSQASDQQCGSGYFLVEPVLSISADSYLRLDLIRCQTYLSKCLGYFENWKEKLEVAYRCGYNAIHFTPVQELGASQSAYSLKDHQRVNPMFNFENAKINYTFDDIAQLIESMRRDWGIVSFTDIVLNHTANETPWLQDHPESAYNLTNSPHLRPAYLLDRALWHVSLDSNSGKWESSGLPKELNSEEHLNRLRDIIKKFYLPVVRLYEMFLINVDEKAKQFHELLQNYANGTYKLTGEEEGPTQEIGIIQDVEYRRFGSTLNLDQCLRKVITTRAGHDHLSDWIQCSVSFFKDTVNDLNAKKTNEIQFNLNLAVENVLSSARYERLDSNGPKLKYVSSRHPLVPMYFTHYGPDTDLASEEQIVYNEKQNQFVMAHNGWVMGDDPLRNFAGPDSNVYLRRELIAWGDSVKLRYGKSPQDCPFLWQYMKEYVVQTAEIFHGIRLDNCHSTPLEVAEYLIDAARQVRPNLFVIAELFTSSEYLDNVFVNRLGINSLIRESMSCPDSQELGRILYRFGGDPVGAFDHRGFPVFSTSADGSQQAISVCKPLIPTVAHAILFDQTHDNESPFKRRTAYDLLPTAALVSMSCSAIGSNRGYDELVPHHIHVVNERRVYAFWDEEPEENKSSSKYVSWSNGIIKARKELNNLHAHLAANGFCEIFLDQVDPETVAVTRFNPNTLQSVVLIARTAFFLTDFSDNGQNIRSIHIAGRIRRVLFEMRMNFKLEKYKRDDFVINGVQDLKSQVRTDIDVRSVNFVKIHQEGASNRIEFVDFCPSSVIAFQVELDRPNIDAVNSVQLLSKQFFDMSASSDIQKLIQKLSLNDLNYVLFRTNQEELDDGHGGGVYDIPNFKKLNYCGLAGIMFYWKDIRTTNDLGHPICDNLRQGLWLPNYVANRLKRRPSTQAIGQWLEHVFSFLAHIPNYLVPRYFDLIITPFYSAVLAYCWKSFSYFVGGGNRLIQLLAFGSVALNGYNKTSPLPPLSSSISPPRPEVNVEEEIAFPTCITIAAGFTHFASGYMRNWGRDTFISLRGLLLTTGRFDEARFIILGFAGVLRHGLIPNLLDKGINARYNCRDAVWWWLQSIKDYCCIAKDGAKLLNEPVSRLYPTDDSPAILDGSVQEKLHQTIQQALQRHFDGIDFIERNAGKKIDEHMKELGFNVTAGICHETGFPYGGNLYNCGTWMDKMGSSTKAGNDGTPATPRDGSAVELVGLCKSVISWLQQSYTSGQYPYDGVHLGNEQWTWQQWAKKLADNFEKKFWISEDSTEDYVNRRAIYRDTLNASERWRDFQLRPNFVIAMAVAPELFEPNHARKALEIVESVLTSRLGMKTLDPSDWNYNGDYVNSDDSDSFKTANGFNYHNGPEWLWPVGYYLRARLVFLDQDPEQNRNFIRSKLVPHFQHLEKSDWFGLPELTNSGGKFCADSCLVQAWSHSTLLDVLYDLQHV